jgi:hypothetical protein
MKCAVAVLFRLLLRAGMTASRLYHRRHVIPAQTDHLEDKGGVIGAAKLFSRVDESFVILGQSFGLMRP